MKSSDPQNTYTYIHYTYKYVHKNIYEIFKRKTKCRLHKMLTSTYSNHVIIRGITSLSLVIGQISHEPFFFGNILLTLIRVVCAHVTPYALKSCNLKELSHEIFGSVFLALWMHLTLHVNRFCFFSFK
jgi:hypothetical protein